MSCIKAALDWACGLCAVSVIHVNYMTQHEQSFGHRGVAASATNLPTTQAEIQGAQLPPSDGTYHPDGAHCIKTRNYFALASMPSSTRVKHTERRAPPTDLKIEPCEDAATLSEVRGALKKLKHDANFLHKVLEARDRQLWPRDLLVAQVTSKKGNPRPIGLIRRSFTFDKLKNCRVLTIDFVWVLPEFRGCGIGRHLMAAGMIAGKPKDVHLQVAGSDDNKAAVNLYTSFGFRWDEAAPKKTEMLLEADKVVAAAAAFAGGTRPGGTSSADAEPLAVKAHVCLGDGGRVCLRLILNGARAVAAAADGESHGKKEQQQRRQQHQHQQRATRRLEDAEREMRRGERASRGGG